MESLWKDVRFGWRTLRARPGFTAAAIVALALGIGANTAIFSVVYAVLLRPLPYRDADRMVVASVSVPDFRDLQDGNTVFDDMAIWATNRYSLSGEGEPEPVLGATVSPNFLPMLGEAFVGRTFRADEDREPLVVLTYELWRRRFGGDVKALGQTLNLGGKSHTIVGVMAPEFHFPSDQVNLWVTFGSAMAQAPQQAENRQLRIFRALARLKPGVSRAQAQAEVKLVATRLQQDHPDTNAGVEIQLTSIYERLVGNVRLALMVLLGAVGLVLLIACANVANLMLARTTARAREMAIRTALGANRWRIARQLLTESLLLSSFGGLLGVLLALWGVDILLNLDGVEIPRLNTVGLDLPVLIFTLLVSVLTGMLFGLAPAWQVTRKDLQDSLREGGRGLAGGRWGARLRGALVVVELALSLVVLMGAGLLIQSFTRLLRIEPGFVSENLVTTNVVVARYQDSQRRATVVRDIVERLEQIPGVQAAGGGTGLPPQTAQRATRYEVDGQGAPPSGAPFAYFLAITPNYFRALGTPFIAGRFFNERDVAGAPGVVIINKSLARLYFPDGNAVGQRLRLINPEQSNELRTIVGVVGDVRYSGLDDPGEAAIYTPFMQTPFPWSYLMIRGTGASLNAGAIRAAISSVAPDLEATRVQTMQQLVTHSVAQPRFYTLLLSGFAAVALILAGVGLYGVLAYGVTQRTHEIGIRMALGAQRRDVLTLVVRQGMLFTLIGVVIGLAASFALTRLMANLLFGVSATDTTTFGMVALLLVGVALLACYVPARRAMKVDPIVALRYE